PQPLVDDVDNEIVAHELPGIHHTLDRLAEFGPGKRRLAQDIAGGHLGDAEGARHPLGLRTLACPRGPEHHGVARHAPLSLMGLRSHIEATRPSTLLSRAIPAARESWSSS